MPESSLTPTAPVADAPKSNRSAMMIVFLVVFIDLLGFGIVLPLLPVIGNGYVSQLVEGEQKPLALDDDNKNPLVGAIVGLLMASFSLMQFLGAPLWGRLSDRVGRRPILLLGLAGSVAFYTLFGVACSLPAAEQSGLALGLLFVARIGAGLAGATISTAQAVIADCTPPDKRKHGMALIGAAFGIGFTFGPLIGALTMWVFSEQHQMVGYTAAALSAVALVLGIGLLPETRQFEEAPPPLNRKWIDFAALKRAVGSPAIGPVILAFFLATLGFAAFETTLAFFNKYTLKFSAKFSFLIFAYVGFVLMLTQGVLYRRLAKRVSEPTFMMMGCLLMALGLVGLGVVTVVKLESSLQMVLVFVSLAIAVVGFAFLTPSAQALISRRTDANQQGEILGVNQSFSALARILGPPIGITLFKLTDPPWLPYAFGAALLLLMLPLMPAVRRG